MFWLNWVRPEPADILYSCKSSADYGGGGGGDCTKVYKSQWSADAYDVAIGGIVFIISVFFIILNNY